MANFQICNLEDFLDLEDNDFISPDKDLESLQPKVDETPTIPEEYICRNSMQDESPKMVEGEITQMLRMAPGILPPVNSFPKSYKPTKPVNLPDFIPNDRQNKIPILLSEKYFKFHGSDDDSGDDAVAFDQVNQNVRGIVNNLDGNDSGINNGNRKNVDCTDRSLGQECTSINIGGDDDFANRFQSVLLSDASESDEDNCNVRCSPDSTSHENQRQHETTQPSQHHHQQYYNARQLYEMKRAKKQ